MTIMRFAMRFADCGGANTQRGIGKHRIGSGNALKL
jgi:hypothetical protein